MSSPRSRGRLLTLAVGAALLAALPSSASAAIGTAPIPSGYVTDGTVNATATDKDGNTFIGGDFTSVGKYTGGAYRGDMLDGAQRGAFPTVDGTINTIVNEPGGAYLIGGEFSKVGGVAVRNAARVTALGVVDPEWKPDPNGAVNAIAVAGDHVYLGGTFTTVGGAPRQKLARVFRSGGGTGLGIHDGSVDTGWNGSTNATSIDVLKRNGSHVYVGGTSLTTIDGQACPGVCRLSPAANSASAAVDQTWQITPALTGSVKALAFPTIDFNTPADTVYIGGKFSSIGGQSRSGLAKVSLTTATVDPTWNPNPQKAGGGEEIRALETNSAKLWVGGSFTTIGGDHNPNIAQLSLTGTGAIDAAWLPGGVNAPVNGLLNPGGELMVVGEFTAVGPIKRERVARLELAGNEPATVSAFPPKFNAPVKAVAYGEGFTFVFGGEFSSAGTEVFARRGAARFKADGTLDTLFATEVDGTVHALATLGNYLYVGGDLSTINKASVSNLARVTTKSGIRDADWLPPIGSSPVTALATSGDDVFIGQGDPDSTDTTTPDSLIKVGAYTYHPTVRDTAWDPDIQGAIRSLLVSGGDLYVGGDFQGVSIGGVTRSHVAKLSTTGNGAANASWNPQPSGPVLALATSGDDLLVGGSFSSVGVVNQARVAKVSQTGVGAPNATWAPAVNGTVRAVAVHGDRAYVGGDFTTASGQAIPRLARFSTSGNGAVDESFVPAPDLTVRGLSATASQVIVGGDFRTLGGRNSVGVAFFDLGAPTITLVSPTNGMSFHEGDGVSAIYTCEDAGGVIASCTGTRVNGAQLDTSLGAHTFTVTATDESGNTTTTSSTYTVTAKPPVQVDKGGTKDEQPAPRTAPGPAPAPKDLVAPLISKSSLAPKSFKAAASGASTVATKGKTPKAGARITLTLSEAATVKGTVIVPKKGKKKAKTVGSFTQAVVAGQSGFDFTGRIAGKKLKPGKYTLELVATDAAGNASKVGKLGFTIKR